MVVIAELDNISMVLLEEGLCPILPLQNKPECADNCVFLGLHCHHHHHHHGASMAHHLSFHTLHTMDWFVTRSRAASQKRRGEMNAHTLCQVPGGSESWLPLGESRPPPALHSMLVALQTRLPYSCPYPISHLPSTITTADPAMTTNRTNETQSSSTIQRATGKDGERPGAQRC
jgi:hypothetical protein